MGSKHTELACEYVSTCGLSFLCDQSITHFGRYRFWYDCPNTSERCTTVVWTEFTSKWNHYNWEKLKLQYWKKYLSQVKDSYRIGLNE
jgi:hypothetical protein